MKKYWKILFLAVLAALLNQGVMVAKERRCGWLANPTPDDWSLTDADNTWILGVQGGYQTPGNYQIRNYNKSEWVYMYPGGTPDYGYGCACLDVVVDNKTKHILSVEDGFYQPLNVCKKDPSLSSPPF